MRIAHLMEAPNALLDNPQFKSWFGNSVTKNSDGTPMVFYHGTHEQPQGQAIGKFKPSPDGLLGPGVYFTQAKDYASSYASKDQGYVMPCYLRIQKPLVVQYNPNGLEVVNQIGAALDDYFMKSYKSWARRQFEDYSGIGDPEFLDMMKGEGYDGVMMMRNGQIEEVTVLYPSQIKSAVGNNGNYSRQSGEVHESAQ